MPRKVYLKLTALDEARRLWLEGFSQYALGAEEVPLHLAQGRTLAAPAEARVSSPAFHGAAMDGAALAAADTFGASERRPLALRVGEKAFWINTGAPLPPGCDAVVMIENLVPGRDADGAETVALEKAAFPWQHVRKLGEDLVATEIILPAGTVLGAYELGALAAGGVLRPLVYKKPRVAVIPSGSELKPLDEVTPGMLAAGAALPEFNGLILSALARDAGAEPTVLPIVPDEPELIREAVSAATLGPYDLVVVNAGSSAGSRDFTPDTIAELGELWVHGVNIMPGKPTALGRVNGKAVLGAPGYPVSAVISFEEFGQTLLARWQGREIPPRPRDEARPFQDLPSRPGTEDFLRVKLGRVDGRLIAVPLPRGAGTVSSLSRADGLIRIPAPAEGLGADRPAPVAFLRPPSQIDGALLAVGSHDQTLDLLDSLWRRRDPGRRLTSAHVGSLGGLTALARGRAHLAGSHLLGPDGVYNRAAVAETLAGTPARLVRLADREQGLILPPGNPRGVLGLADLARPDVTFINRQRGSGTRVLFDRRLRQIGLEPAAVNGYEDEEYTHLAVAAAVLSGRASAGLGARAAAAALGLDFLPLDREEYDLVIPERHWDDPRMQSLLETVRSPEFHAAAAALGGYGLTRTGQVVWTFEG